MSEQVKRVNKILASKYGENLRGEPIFRISWSDDQLEKRFGVYNEFYGDIFIRTIRGLKEVPKYPYIRRAWILERWAPPELAYTDEIPETANGSYEPVFVFQTDKGVAIPIIEKEIYAIIYNLFHPRLPGQAASEDRTAEEVAFKKEVERNLEEITEAGRTWIGHRLASKEAIIKP